MTQRKLANPMDKRIGIKISKIRKKYGISMSKLANNADVDYKTLWNCENGYNSLTIRLLIKICKGLNSNDKSIDIDLNYLFDYLVTQSIDNENT